jgi:UDPglucose--hexose-1-phosphate uridylyltransferase
MAPWAARMPFQLSLYPRLHQADMLAVPETSSQTAMAIIQSVYQAYDAWFGHRTALVFSLSQAPTHGFDPGRYHFRFDFLPIERGAHKIKYLAGSELAMGAFVGDMLPETVAQSLKPLVEEAFSRYLL